MFDLVKPCKNRDKLLLFCPIETKAREMDAKILLACVAAERGHKVVVGNMGELRRMVEFLPRGVYLSKSVPEKMEKVFRRYKSLGYGVTSWCEEGLVFLSREDYMRKMVAPGTLRQADLFFAWGENQTRAITDGVPETKAKIRCVGNPRLDMLRAPYRNVYRDEADRLHAKYGNYILFNTNFSIVNSMLGVEEAFRSFKERGKVRTSEEETRYWQHYEHKRVIFEGMKRLIKSVSQAQPDKQIIVRPHPSENHDTWREAAAELPNVEVVYEGAVIPWLMAADVLVHNGCTTAVEAYFLETPAIAFRPAVKEGYELELPNSISLPAKNAEEVDKMLGLASRKDDEYTAWRQAAKDKLKAHVSEPDGDYSCDRIVAELENYYSNSPLDPELPVYRLARRLKRRAGVAMRTVAGMNKTAKSEQQLIAEKYRRQKFPYVSTEEVENLIAKLQRESGRFDGVGATRVRWAERCFVVERA